LSSACIPFFDRSGGSRKISLYPTTEADFRMAGPGRKVSLFSRFRKARRTETNPATSSNSRVPVPVFKCAPAGFQHNQKNRKKIILKCFSE
jgi:hypothetical protein